MKISFFLFPVLMLVLVVIFPLEYKAQSAKQYRGPHTFYGIEGSAQYDYLQFKRDSTIREGKFDFSQKYTDSLDNQIFYKFQVSGQYKQDRKFGTWQYIDARHRISVKDVAFFNVKASLDSELRETTANYNERGMPHGPWKYKVLRYKDEQIIDLLTSPKLTFNEGNVSGAFGLTSDESEGYFGLYDLNGRCTETGLMDSLWTFRYVRDTLQILEHRLYDEGFLIEVTKMTDNGARDTLFAQQFNETLAKLRVIKEGGSALFKVSDRDFDVDYMAGFDVEDKRFLTQKHGNGYLKDILEDLTRFSTEVYYLDGRAISYPIKTKRFEFTIPESDDSLRGEMQVKYLELSEIIEEVMGSTTIGLNRKRTDSLYFANLYIELLDSLLGQLRYPIAKALSDDFKYFDTYGYNKEQRFDFMETDSIILITKDSKILIHENFNEGFDEMGSLLERLYHYVDRMHRRATRFRAVINEQLEQLQIGDELEALQQKIISGHEELSFQFKTIKYYNKDERDLYNAIRKTFLQDQFEQFTDDYGKDDFEASKVDKANQYLEMLYDLGSQIRPIAAVYRNQDILDSIYKEEVFNPFTYTTYQRRVKEDLFKKGTQLFEYYVEELKGTVQYEKISFWLERIERLQKRMEYLRNPDTRGLERNLRGSKSPAEIEKLLDISPEIAKDNG